MASSSNDRAEFGSYAALLRRRSAWIIAIVPAAVLLAVYVAFSAPTSFRSSATIILERGSIANDLIQTTVATSANQEIEIIQGRALTLEALKKLVQAYDPYPDRPDWNLERKAQQVMMDTSLERVDPVTGKPLEDSPAFSLHYVNANSQRAAIVTRRLAEVFLSYHQQSRRNTAESAAKLMQDRANALTKELESLDAEYARLRASYGGTLPDETGRSEDAAYRAGRDVDDLERQLRMAQDRQSLLAIQLSSTSPNLMSTNKTGDLTDLSSVKAQLADAEQRYTPDHPDVKRLRRALAALQGQGAAGGPAGSADNPEYRRINSELSSARNEASALQASVARARQKLAQYSSSLNLSAEASRRVSDVERRRQSLQTQFQDVQGKLKSAQLGQLVESDEFSERFSMVKEPYPASSPFSPNRPGMILLGLVLGSAIAAVAVAIAESTDSTVRGVRDVLGLRNVPVLGTVAEILLPEEIRRRRTMWGAVSAVYVAATIFVAVSVVQTTLRERGTAAAELTAKAQS